MLHLVELLKKNHLNCIQKKIPYLVYPFCSSTLTTTIMMVKNNQVQACDDGIPMIIVGIHSTDGDGDYKSFSPSLNLIPVIVINLIVLMIVIADSDLHLYLYLHLLLWKGQRKDNIT